MSVPSGWQLVTGEGHVDFGGFATINTVGLWLPHDAPNSPFIGTDHPRRIRFAGMVGLGYNDLVLPDGVSTDNELILLHWLQTEYDIWGVQGTPFEFALFYWRIPVGLELYYQLNV